MLKLRDEQQVYLYHDAVDMRKSIDGLVAIIVDAFDQSPTSGNVFVFCNRSRDKVKIIYWDRNGFVLHYKRLEKGRFKCMPNEGMLVLSQEQLSWLLAGLEFMLMNEFKELDFAAY